jgi:hypothetical protein
MGDQKQIEISVEERFSFLSESGFTQIKVKRSSLITTISFLTEKIGIQIEIDWRERGVFVLLAKLDEGELPKGYYASMGQTVRISLVDYLKKLKKSGTEIDIPQIYYTGSARGSDEIKADFGRQIDVFSKLLKTYLHLLPYDGNILLESNLQQNNQRT